ncbi:MltA-interacting MipA family protein [Enterovibrio norvegicus]|uniref:MipA/OmpV family protein n=1 Tax=Enterovibrio norvegicus TaxID=188144 RepID=A0ABV4L0N5_9GAMM|nr:MipA/OmpV family protein [Enterovibrio norvegicus]OEF53006.1 MltA-interacting MipA family protein [Enterovibrio norvegicus]OEF55723.1 MltA-interacting MipA family protein [Enterovibrio norvegicus]
MVLRNILTLPSLVASAAIFTSAGAFATSEPAPSEPVLYEPVPSEPLPAETTEETPADIETLRSKRSENWGIAATMRSAGIPYKGTGSDYVSSFVPMMFYQDEAFFINGTEGGIRLWEKEEWRLNAILRMRFIDLPRDVQNDIGGDTGDYGFQLKRDFGEGWYTDLEFLSDKSERFHGIVTLGKTFESDDYFVDATASVRYKDANFNSYYYGLSEFSDRGERLGAGADIKIGVRGRYHVYSNLYLVGATYATYFDSNVRNASSIETDWQGEVFAGFGFFNDNRRHGERELSTRPYWRVAHGWATPSNIGDIIAGDSEKDPFNNQLTSLFYGHPLTDSLFGVPLDIYLTPGVVWHWNSKVQASSSEFVMAIKAFYEVEWPTKWRIGVAEGLSYVNNITYIEQTELDEKGYEPSNLLNYIDLSLDVNLGDLFNVPALDRAWLGYSIHHRSAIFEKASQFGRIKGGSNYNTLYVQVEF